MGQGNTGTPTEQVAGPRPSGIYAFSAPRYEQAGYWPRPVDPNSKPRKNSGDRGKGCTIEGWQEPGPGDPSWARRYFNHGLSLLMGSPFEDGTKLGGVDVDGYKKPQDDDIPTDRLVAIAGAVLQSPCAKVGSKGQTFFVRVPANMTGTKIKDHKGRQVGDLLFESQICVLPPTIHQKTGRPYQWVGTPLLECSSDALPLFPEELFSAVFTSEHLPVLVRGEDTHDAVLRFAGQLVALADDETIVNIVGAALPADYDGDSLEELPRMLRDARKKGFDAATYVELTDSDLAHEFASRHHHELRFVPTWGRWKVWDTQRWRDDDKRWSFSFAQALCREVSEGLKRETRKRLRSAPQRAAVVSMAQDLMSETVEIWDQHPMLFCTPNGSLVLDGPEPETLVANDPGLYMTKVAAVSPDPNMAVPLWEEFIEHATGGDKEFALYLQKLCGYCLSGLTVEKAVFFIWGPPNSGKTTFINTLAGILGDFHVPMPESVYTAQRFDSHPTELACLAGARLVTASEVDEGRAWNEARLNRLSGGDPMPARYIAKDPFTFTPQFKMIVAGNHKPILRSSGGGMSERLRVIPFTIPVPANRVDKHFRAKLEAEWPGILSWMVQGCALWRKEGLRVPAVIRDATDEYLEEQDVVTLFLETCVRQWGPENAGEPRELWNTASSTLFHSWCGFCRDQGQRPGHQKVFNDRMRAKGLRGLRTKTGLVWENTQLSEEGLRLVDHTANGAPSY